MGAWEFVRPSLEGLVGGARLSVLARPRSSSPAEGSAARHAQNQERLIAQAFETTLRLQGDVGAIERRREGSPDMSINIVVPEVGESIVDARVARWLKREGDAVAAGEPLVELETDKVDVEVAAPKAGVLERIAHEDGADVKIGEVLGTIAAGDWRRGRTPPLPAAVARDDQAASRSRRRRRRGRRRASTTCALDTREGRWPARDEGGCRASGAAGVATAPSPQPRCQPPRRPAASPKPRAAGRRCDGGRRAAKSACACPSAARRSRSAWSRRSRPPRCSRPSTRST